jgi:hypothetical protein
LLSEAEIKNYKFEVKFLGSRCKYFVVGVQPSKICCPELDEY